MIIESVFLTIMVIAALYFFFLGDVTSKELAVSRHEHPVYITELTTKAVFSYSTSFICSVAAILCILRMCN